MAYGEKNNISTGRVFRLGDNKCRIKVEWNKITGNLCLLVILCLAGKSPILDQKHPVMGSIMSLVFRGSLFASLSYYFDV